MAARLLNETFSSRALRTTIQSELGNNLWLKESNSFHFQYIATKTLTKPHTVCCKICQQLLMVLLFYSAAFSWFMGLNISSVLRIQPVPPSPLISTLVNGCRVFLGITSSHLSFLFSYSTLHMYLKMQCAKKEGEESAQELRHSLTPFTPCLNEIISVFIAHFPKQIPQ